MRVLFKLFIIVLVFVLFCVLFSYLTITLKNITDSSKCPYCYGRTFCDDVENISLDNSFLGRIINWFNSKNVYYGELNNIDVVIKKLGSDTELAHFDSALCTSLSKSVDCDICELNDNRNYTEAILESLADSTDLLKPFRVCSIEASEAIYEDILKVKPEVVLIDDYLKNVWTILKINVEPLILQLLKAEDNWPVQKFYGSCGRLVVEESRGVPLLDWSTADWMDRAYFAVQLLHIAKNLTDDHPKYRFYLTDISPDNIAIDDKLKVTFIDLENMIVQRKNHTDIGKIHRSEKIQDSDGFAFSGQEICEHEKSDHNYYAICSLILSKDAPSPMMKYGLLNSPPRNIVLKYPRLFELIEDCATSESSDRFQTAQKIVNMLNAILRQSKTYSTIVID